MQTRSKPASPLEQPPRPPLERSPFWAVALLGSGAALAVLLLIGLRFDRPLRLLYALPLLLIAALLERVLGRGRPAWGAGLGALGALGVSGLLFYSAQGVGTVGPLPLLRETLSVPLEQATSARVTLQTGGSDLDVRSGSRLTLLWARGQHAGGKALLAVVPGAARQVSLRETEAGPGCNPCVGLPSSERQFWNVQLARALPISLSTSSGSGSALLDLRSLEVREVRWNGGSGALDASFSPSLNTLETQSTLGSQKLSVAAGSRVRASLSSGAGDLRLELGPKVQATLSLESTGGDQLLRAGPDAVLSGRMLSRSGTLELGLAEGTSGRLTLETPGGNVRLDLAATQGLRLRVLEAGRVRLGAMRQLEGGVNAGLWESRDLKPGGVALELKVRAPTGEVSLR